MTDFSAAIAALEHEAEELHLQADRFLAGARFLRRSSIPESTLAPTADGAVAARTVDNSGQSSESIVQFRSPALAEMDVPDFLRRTPK